MLSNIFALHNIIGIFTFFKTDNRFECIELIDLFIKEKSFSFLFYLRAMGNGLELELELESRLGFGLGLG